MDAVRQHEGYGSTVMWMKNNRGKYVQSGHVPDGESVQVIKQCPKLRKNKDGIWQDYVYIRIPNRLPEDDLYEGYVAKANLISSQRVAGAPGPPADTPVTPRDDAPPVTEHA